MKRKKQRHVNKQTGIVHHNAIMEMRTGRQLKALENMMCSQDLACTQCSFFFFFLGGEGRPMCPHTIMSLHCCVSELICPCTDVSPHQYVPALMCPKTDMSPHQYVPALLCPRTEMSPHQYVPTQLCPSTMVSVNCVYRPNSHGPLSTLTLTLRTHQSLQ